MRLECQLLKYLVERALRPEMLEYTVTEFMRRIDKGLLEFMEAQKRAQFELPKLKAELRKLQIEARNLGTAIAEYGVRRSPTLMSQLTFMENRIETIERQIHESQPDPPKVSAEKVRQFVLEQASQLENILQGDRMAAKQALRTHLHPLVLAPKETAEG